MKIFILLLNLSLLVSCNSNNNAGEIQNIPFKGVKECVNFSELEPYFHKDNDTTYLINFWATTCPPCLKEFPYFEKLSQEMKGKNLELLFINIDGKNHLEDRLFTFLDKRSIDLPIIALTDPNANKWTEAVNPDWYGALPYTIIYKKDKKKYFFGAFENYAQLEKEVLLSLSN